MKARIFAVVLMIIASLSVSPAYSAQGKTAVVDLGRAIFSTNVAQKRLDEAKKNSEVASLQAKYDSIAADAKALQKEVESKQMTMSQEDAAEYRKKMDYYKADMELVVRKIQAESKMLQNKILSELQPKAGEALKELVKEEGISLLISAEAAIIVDPMLDITGKLTDRLNSKTK